jgi:hypothetical protein
MKFDTKFIQFTSLGLSIYRLTKNLNLLKFRLWLSVRTEDSVILSLLGPRSDGMAERPDGLCYNSFLRSNGTLNILKYWTASRCVATSSGRLAETSLTLSTSEIQLNVE